MKRLSYDEILQNPDLIHSINQAFHDVEAATYQERHPEIYQQEAIWWRDTFSTLFLERKDDEGIVVLDVGTGNGFVPASIMHLLDNKDTVIFSDISKEMLRVCQKKFRTASFRKKFLITDSTHFDVADQSIDCVTLNSVLHHIPNITDIFHEIERILKPGGFLIIRHEPNLAFGKTVFLRNLYLLIRYMNHLKTYTKNKISMLVHKDRDKTSYKNTIYDEVIWKLRKQKIYFDDTIGPLELQSIVDIHSPTARGDYNPQRGFNPEEIHRHFFPNASYVDISTYGYLGKINDRTTIFRRLFSAILQSRFPEAGYFFDLIIKK